MIVRGSSICKMKRDGVGFANSRFLSMPLSLSKQGVEKCIFQNRIIVPLIELFPSSIYFPAVWPPTAEDSAWAGVYGEGQISSNITVACLTHMFARPIGRGKKDSTDSSL